MHINCDIYTSKKELHTLVTDLETTYDYLAESDMNTDDEGDANTCGLSKPHWTC